MAAQTSPASVPIDDPSQRRLPILLRRAWYGMNQAFRRRIAPLGLTPDQFTVMRTILENEGITQRQLTTLISSDPNTVASLLERMEKAGLVARSSCDRDRRAKRIKLTDAARKKYVKARRIAINLQSRVLEALPEEKRGEFLECLATVAGVCRAAAEARPSELS